MKSIAALIVGIIVIYSMYHDLTVGTLPNNEIHSISTSDEMIKGNNTYTLIEIKQGDTVLSVLEQLTQGSLPVSIEQAVDDFTDFNNGVKPEQIQTGETYKFPLYR
ncbi:hypothetical protein [Lederbergia lenta]|uniref:LysM domain-containing protein n=1 Tax=Lederbergia lenta TaxID=1467 RepID=A0A2X4WEH6_LEDLE|nr:hypothetical protein [Lederbergia lenta]MEC2325205.1 hypothetical protein [Lederbergia lenta]SQI56030.1 Uncharacterised protein [Lederbergia lenta]